MKHANAEMIKAVVDNTELVIFFKEADDARWSRTNINSLVNACSTTEYFLCLPQHKEACLHWLNGGDVQDWYRDDWSDCGFYDGTTPWSSDHMFMDDSAKYRIKPKKEKRWIAYDEAGDCFEQTAFASVKEAEDQIKYSDVQFIEIEVEV